MNKQENQKNKFAVVYVRVSTTEQADEGNSLVTQEKACREYAGKHGFELADGGIFVERGESAKTADRTQLQKMLAFCAQKKNNVCAVIVYKIDRLSRNTDDYSQLRILLKRYGVSIKSTTENIEDTPVGRFMENTMANIAQFDNDIRAERCSNGMREAVREGRYVWNAPIGYSNGARSNGKPTISKNSMAPLVLESFNLVASGLYSTTEVWRMMCTRGLNLPSGKTVSKAYFHIMLRNRLFAGHIDKFGESHKGLFEQIVTDELFEQVQRVIKNKGHKVAEYKTDNPDFPLRRFVFSPTGLKLTGSWSTGRPKKYPYYRFAKGCNFERDGLENKFGLLMDSYHLESRQIEKIKRFVKVEFHEATKKERQRANELEARIKELAVQQSTLVKKNLAGVLKDAVLTQELERIERETFEAQSELVLMRNSVDTSPEEAVDFAQEYLQKPSEFWKKASPSTRIKLQWFQFPVGVVFDGEKFGTAEIGHVFKVKDLLLLTESTNVHSSVEFWHRFVNGCAQLTRILKDEENMAVNGGFVLTK